MGKYDEAGNVIRQYLQSMAGPSKGSSVPALLAARRSMIDVRPGVSIDIPLVTPRGGDWSAVNEADRLGLIDGPISQLKDRQVGGLFSPSEGRYPGVGMVMYRQGDRATRRHEVMHGLTEAARRGYQGMPAASRLAARLPRFLSVPLDEMAATKVGGDSLLTKSWPWYASYYAKHGDYGPAAVYAGLGAAQAGVVAAGVGAGASLAARGLADDSDGLDQDGGRYLTYEEMRRLHTPSGAMSQDDLIERLNQ